MEHLIDDIDFINAIQLAERIQDWVTSPDLGIADGAVLYIESGDGGVYRRACLIEKTLTDGSKVYDVRLS